MDYPKSVPNVGLVNGKFIDENTTTGVVGSLIPCDWGNAVTDEILNVILAAGQVPAEANHGQLLAAINAIITGAIPAAPPASSETVAGLVKLVTDALLTAGVDDSRAVTAKKLAAKLQGQGFTAFTTAGVAPAYTLTPVPALDAYAPNKRFQIKFHAGGAGADTINISGLGPKALKQYDSAGNKVAAVIQGQVTDAVYDGTDVVLLDQIPVSASETVQGVVELANSGEVASGIDAVRAVTPAALAVNYTQKFAMVLTEERPTNVSPGNNLNGTNVRQLNTIRSNTIAGASLASNQITLPAGSYHVVGSSPFFNGDRHRCYLHNVTDNVAVLLGTSENGGTAFTTRSIVRGFFSTSATKVFEFRHSMQVAQTNGLGDPCADGQAEVYAEIEFVRGGS